MDRTNGQVRPPLPPPTPALPSPRRLIRSLAFAPFVDARDVQARQVCEYSIQVTSSLWIRRGGRSGGGRPGMFMGMEYYRRQLPLPSPFTNHVLMRILRASRSR